MVGIRKILETSETAKGHVTLSSLGKQTVERIKSSAHFLDNEFTRSEAIDRFNDIKAIQDSTAPDTEKLTAVNKVLDSFSDLRPAIEQSEHEDNFTGIIASRYAGLAPA